MDHLSDKNAKFEEHIKDRQYDKYKDLISELEELRNENKQLKNTILNEDHCGTKEDKKIGKMKYSNNSERTSSRNTRFLDYMSCTNDNMVFSESTVTLQCSKSKI